MMGLYMVGTLIGTIILLYVLCEIADKNDRDFTAKLDAEEKARMIKRDSGE